MTLCIAARMFDHATRYGAIFTVSDLNMSTAAEGLDLGAVKTTPLHGSGPWSPWFSMYSGDPTTHAGLLHHIRSVLNSQAKAWSHVEVMDIVRAAYDTIIDERTERKFPLKPYGITSLADLLDPKYAKHSVARHLIEGRESAHAEVINEMYADPTHLLVCGFDPGNEPHIFSSDQIGICTLHDDYTFRAIGMNANRAEAWLLAHNDFRYAGESLKTIYRLCEAKFIAEIDNEDIGKTTIGSVWASDGLLSAVVLHAPSLQDAESQAVRKAFEASRWREIEPRALFEIAKQLRANQRKNQPTPPPKPQA